MSKTYYCEDIYETWPDKNDNRRCYNLFEITENGDYKASFINQENILNRLAASEKQFFNVNLQTQTITISTADEHKLEFKEADEDFLKQQKTLSIDLRMPRHDSSKYKKKVRWESNSWEEVDDSSDPYFWSVSKKTQNNMQDCESETTASLNGNEKNQNKQFISSGLAIEKLNIETLIKGPIIYLTPEMADELKIFGHINNIGLGTKGLKNPKHEGKLAFCINDRVIYNHFLENIFGINCTEIAYQMRARELDATQNKNAQHLINKNYKWIQKWEREKADFNQQAVPANYLNYTRRAIAVEMPLFVNQTDSRLSADDVETLLEPFTTAQLASFLDLEEEEIMTEPMQGLLVDENQSQEPVSSSLIPMPINAHALGKRKRSDDFNEEEQDVERYSPRAKQSLSDKKKPWEKHTNFSAKYTNLYQRLYELSLFSTLGNSTHYATSFSLQELQNCNTNQNLQTIRAVYPLQIGDSLFRLATLHNSLPNEEQTVSFIFAGRLEDAMLPKPEQSGTKQRLLLVVSAAEYEHLAQQNYPLEIDFLIIDSLASKSHGNYEITSNIQARRLAAFLVSYHLQLKDCVYLDDNLAAIQGNDALHPLSTWSDVTTRLKIDREKNEALISGLRTLSHKPRYHLSQDYCYKLFSLNFQQICDVLNINSAEDVFILGYPANYADYCMEDYFFQMVIDFALWDKKSHEEDKWTNTTLMYTPSLEDMNIVRSRKHQNAAQTRTTGLLEHIVELDVDTFVPPMLVQPQSGYMRESLKHLQQLIKKTFKSIEQKLKTVQMEDFRVSFYQSNQKSLANLTQKHTEEMQLKPQVASSKERKVSKIKELNIRIEENQYKLNELLPDMAMLDYIEKNAIAALLYPHQMQALKNISTYDSSAGIIKMTTGSGKTRVQILLANLLIQQNPKALIHIVTPTIQLADQFYNDFQNVLTLSGDARAIDPLNVIKVHSESNAVDLGFFLLNQPFQELSNILIFCEDSYFKFMQETAVLTPSPRAPLITFLDEFHLYKRYAQKLMNSGLSILGFSATPGKEAKSIIYDFSREASLAAKITAPLIIDKLPYSLKQSNNAKKHEKIATLLKQHCHPQGKPLECYKGIIYASSIKEANQIVAIINHDRKEPLATAVHSGFKDAQTRIEKFTKKATETPAILVAVDMLITGYDDNKLAWLILAKEKKVGEDNQTQMIGRVLRTNPDYPDKIAYVLVDGEFKHKDFEVYKDNEALLQANKNYFYTNRQVIYLELMHAIENKLPFQSYLGLFTANKLELKDYSLAKQLQLIMTAILTDNDEWVVGILKNNQMLGLTWRDNKEQEFNLLSTFLNEIFGLQEASFDKEFTYKQNLFNFNHFKILLNKLYNIQPHLLRQLLSETPAQATLITQLSGLNEPFKELVNEYYRFFFKKALIINSFQVSQVSQESMNKNVQLMATSHTNHSLSPYNFFNTTVNNNNAPVPPTFNFDR